MPQTKIYGNAEFIQQNRELLSNTIHSCVVDAFNYPPEKKFQRFFPLLAEDFEYPSDRSDKYIIIEILMFSGRSVEAKKTLHRLLFDRLKVNLDINPLDVEVILIETPSHNWGIRGMSGDELNLSYKVNV
ncbi:tautomerase family protein [Pseudanabaena sp. FACHB-1998]|uniref:tautomerase family protein n=1 Tax=Pseudanabaena sp. FACHB-1998 TaxID=2692858 RepID=UPI0016805E06|nr:tautomerase family protein [Pseudanabaena sp. FACHB-1998]MBD2176503.1 tautomerase family protein [Pseudanabaena sp. FACHB-1998]